MSKTLTKLWGILKWVWAVFLLGSSLTLGLAALYDLSQGRPVTFYPALNFVWANYPYVGGPSLLLILITLTSWWGSHREERRAAWEGLARRFFTLKPVRDLDPVKGDLRLSAFHPFYLHRQALADGSSPQPVSAEDRVASLLQQGEMVLVTGKPKQGKTRLAYEVLRRFPQHYLLQPHAEVLRVGELDLSPLRGQPVVLFLDDLDHFIDRFDPEDLKRHIESAGCPCYLLSTCRTGEEMAGVRERMGPFLAKLKEVGLGDMSPAEGQQVAQKTEKPWDPTAFDGTPGSVLLGLRDMEVRYQNLPPEQKGVMKALKLLYRAGIFTYTYQRLKAVMGGIWGFENIPRYEWEATLQALYSQGFLTHYQDPVQAEDAYLEGVIGDYPSPQDDFPALIALLSRLGDAGGLFSYGVSRFLAYQYKEALEAFEKALGLKPDLPEAWVNKGATLERLGRYAEALEASEKALALKPDYPEAWGGKGLALGGLGRYAEALEASEEDLRLKPDYPDAWVNKGAALGGLGRDAEALAAFEKALALKPDYPEAWANKGAALIELGRDAEALAAFEKALALKPDLPEAWLGKGLALGGLGRDEEAEECLRRAAELFRQQGRELPPSLNPYAPPDS